MNQKNCDRQLSLKEEAASGNTSSERLAELANISDELAEIVASNLTAPSELLTKLADRDSDSVRKAVVSNPNTPTETLFELGEYFPSELLDNPIFELLYLENPSFVKGIPCYTLLALVGQNEAPQFLLKYAANYFYFRKIVELAELHINLSGEMKKGWHELANDKMSDFLFWNLINKGEVQLLSHFADFLPNQIFTVNHLIEKIAGNKNTSLKIINKLATSEYYYIKNSIIY